LVKPRKPAAEGIGNLWRKGSNRAPLKIFKVAVLSGALVKRQQAFSGARQRNGKKETQGYLGVDILPAP